MKHNKLTISLCGFLAVALAVTMGKAQQVSGRATPISLDPDSGCNTVAFDVKCGTNEIDANWCASVKVKRDNAADVEIEVPLLDGMHEDTIAAHVADEINDAAGDGDDPASVTEVENGADQVVINGGTICASVGRGNQNCGHIKLDYSNCSRQGRLIQVQPWVPAPRIDCFVLPFLGGFDFTIEVHGTTNGTPWTLTGTSSIDGSHDVASATAQIIADLQAQGFMAVATSGGIRIRPGTDAESFTAGTVSNESASTTPSLHYGMEVRHNL